MIKITFTEEEKQQIRYDRYHHPHPRVRQKMEVLHLKSIGLQLQLICTIACVSPNTARNYIKEFLKGGLKEIRKVKFYQPQSKLEKHRESIKEYLQKHPPATISEASAKINELTGIKRGMTQTRKFLKKSGFKFRKVGSIPAIAANEEKKTSKGFS